MKKMQRGKYESTAKHRRPSAKNKAQKHLFRALVSSVVSMVLCMTMFLSTTMAWFTDTVESSGNQITVGELKVDVLYDGVSLKTNTQKKIFDGNVIWKPNHLEVRTLTVSNSGNLDLKYVLNLNLSQDTASIAQYFDVYVRKGTADANVTVEGLRAADSGWTHKGSLLSMNNGGGNLAEGSLEAAKNSNSAVTETYSIAIHMKPGVETEAAQGKTVLLNIKLNAYQADMSDAEIRNPSAYVSTSEELANAINEGAGEINLTVAGEYKMPSAGRSGDIRIKGTKDTVINLTQGAYLDSATVSFEGVTIMGSTGKVNGNGSDYAALYTPNVTYTNCTFDGPFRIGRDGATFINCTFTNLVNDYVWTYGNDCTFSGCTFNTDGKALLIYSDGGNEVSEVVVENCVFNASKGATASAIANQNCAAIEIENYGNGVNLTASGNSFDTDNFSGEWRIKAYHADKPAVIVNGTEYTTIALDGKTIVIDSNKNVTVNE